MSPSLDAPALDLPVFLAEDLLCTQGVNHQLSLSFASELFLDDLFELREKARAERLSILPSPTRVFMIAPASTQGRPGARVHLDSTLTFMSPEGGILEVLLFVEVGPGDRARQIYALPLIPLMPKTEYRLIGIDTANVRKRFAQIACTSFARGTQITLGSGEQRAIEALRPGDRVLTRDGGVQEIRWIGETTTRALGDFAPIRIEAGVLNNARDLLLSPECRLFVYQRRDSVGAGRAEVLIKARHLVNGDSVRVQEGGFVDYFQLLFDRHAFLYAEGIAAETLLIDARTQPVLPDTLFQVADRPFPGHSDPSHGALEVGERLCGLTNLADLLRRASLC